MDERTSSVFIGCDGSTALENGLIPGLIGIVIITAVITVGTKNVEAVLNHQARE